MIYELNLYPEAFAVKFRFFSGEKRSTCLHGSCKWRAQNWTKFWPGANIPAASELNYLVFAALFCSRCHSRRSAWGCSNPTSLHVKDSVGAPFFHTSDKHPSLQTASHLDQGSMSTWKRPAGRCKVHASVHVLKYLTLTKNYIHNNNFKKT